MITTTWRNSRLRRLLSRKVLTELKTTTGERSKTLTKQYIAL